MASFLKSQGYQAYALTGGYLAWYRAGYPIERKTATTAMPLNMMCPDCGRPLESHINQDAD